MNVIGSIPVGPTNCNPGSRFTIENLGFYVSALRDFRELFSEDSFQRFGRVQTSLVGQPHVHAQLMDRVSPLVAQGLPMVFRSIALEDGLGVRDALPGNNEHMVALDLGID
ncbi:hypothetical protein [Arthrobacter sp. YC-RL1]|uniref:hypothetical protein n=1 Tax=Arthrobacter sp. YC-RL1 TaxID=1652545 RepID=UPI0009E2F5D5|nr:hypothetical protein [Arthrobacter sp. YC-RL1]